MCQLQNKPPPLSSALSCSSAPKDCSKARVLWSQIVWDWCWKGQSWAQALHCPANPRSDVREIPAALSKKEAEALAGVVLADLDTSQQEKLSLCQGSAWLHPEHLNKSCLGGNSQWNLIESWNGLRWEGPESSSCSTLCQTEIPFPIPGCPKPYPSWPCTLAGI